LAGCRITLDHLTGDPADNSSRFGGAERYLKAALEGQPPPPAEWKPAAQCLFIAAIAGQRRYDDAGALVKDVVTAAPATLLDLLQRLGALPRSDSPDERRQRGKLSAPIAEALSSRRSELTDAQRRRFDALAAGAVADGGDAKTAAEMFAKLAAAHPKDGDIQEAYGAVLLEVGDRPSLDKALVKWLQIERNSREGTPRWFRARYHLALAQHRRGDNRRAAQTIVATRTLYAELGGAELKAKFLELLKQCQ
jgi:hypothetical protein